MNLKTLFTLCSAVCDKHISKNEQACIRLGDELIPYTELKEEIDKVKEWCSPDVETERLKKVICCQDCKHYIACTQASHGSKPQVIMRCELSNEVCPKTHYCGYAKERG